MGWSKGQRLERMVDAALGKETKDARGDRAGKQDGPGPLGDDDKKRGIPEFVDPHCLKV
jgi:hypothetical protein